MKYAKPEWRDGQPYSPDYKDVYFSVTSGEEETEHVFIQNNQLIERFAQCKQQKTSFVIAETGFGSGLNFLITARHWLEHTTEDNCLYFYSIENTPFTPDDLRQAHQAWPDLQQIATELQQQYQVPSYGFHCFELFQGRIKLILMIGDVENMLPQMQASVDAWFLDGFAPSLNPQMWNHCVFRQIARLSHQGSTFSTYTAVGDVRRGLIDVGFNVSKVSGCGNKRHMLSGVYEGNSVHSLAIAQPWYALPEKKPVKPTGIDKEVCIIGAGIAGLTTAWSFVRRGYKVEMIEAGEHPGAQASGNPQAMIMPRLSLQDSADAEFYTSAYFYALRCLQQIDSKQQSWQQTGGLQLPSSERISKHIEQYPQDKALAEVLEADEASRVCGLEMTQPAHYFPLAVTLQPPKLLQKLISLMGDALSIRYNCSIKSFKYIKNEWQLYGNNDEEITRSQCLILATSWQTRRFKQLEYLHLQPARGQLSLLKENQQSRQLHVPLSYKGYMLPSLQGEHVVGASFELDDCSSGLTEQAHQENLQDNNRWFNGLFNTSSINGGRASVRAVTPDRAPIVGPVPDEKLYNLDYAELYKGKPAHKYTDAKYIPDLFVNTGHGARGFTSAFISAELLAAYICEEALPVSNRVRYALHPARSLIRSLKKKRKQ